MSVCSSESRRARRLSGNKSIGGPTMKRSVCFLWSLIVLAGVAGAAGAALPKPLSDEQLAKIVAGAPAMPADLELGLSMRLIDFIDCTDPNDPHDFRDQGTSSVVTGPAGTYRITASHRHAFFSYAFRTAGRDKPVLIVVEYPDDADRIISYMTHDSMRAKIPHTSFSQETGVYTGGALPLTGKMQYFTLVSWPQDDWSPLITLNFAHDGGAGAAARIWVYAIDAMPPLEVDAPDPERQRTLDAFFCLAFLAQRDNFGWQSPRSIEHMCDYLKLIGANRATMEVYANQSWGKMCSIPSWDCADDKGYLDGILRQMDAKGGVGMIAGIVADGMYGDVISGGKKVRDMEPEQARAVILKGFDEFIDRYGKYASLKGIALGSMETIGFLDTLQAKGMLADVVAHIKQRRPDFEVLTYVGNWRLQTPQFSGREGMPTAGEVISGWEQAGGPDWPQYLAGLVHRNYRTWKHDPVELKKVDGLAVYEMVHPNDHRLHALYTNEPRQAIYYDTFRSRPLSDAVATPYAAIFDTFTEGHIGLHEDVNFWYTKPWTGPDFNPAGELAIMPWSRVMAHGDRQSITAGAWSVKYFGLDDRMRRFSRAYRSLPPVTMEEVPLGDGGDTAVVRWVRYKDKRYVSVVSQIPFASQATVDGKAVALKPFELAVLKDDAPGAPRVRVAACEPYAAWVKGRLDAFEALRAEVAALDAKAAPKVYAEALARGRQLLAAGKPYAADVALGHGLAGELQLRKDILMRPRMAAPRIASAPPMDGRLDAWPKEASDLAADTGDYLLGHVYFVNSWTGPDDLSARVRLAHDGQKLYVGIEVCDDIVASYDEQNRRNETIKRSDVCALRLSTDGAYKDWTKPRGVAGNIRWAITLPFDADETSGKGAAGFQYTCRRTPTGYVVEGSAPLAELNVSPGQAFGWLLEVGDVDRTPNVSMHSWSRKQSLYVPRKVNFDPWSDARNCGEVVLER